MELNSVGTRKDPHPPKKELAGFWFSLKAPMTTLNTDIWLRRLRGQEFQAMIKVRRIPFFLQNDLFR